MKKLRTTTWVSGLKGGAVLGLRGNPQGDHGKFCHAHVSVECPQGCHMGDGIVR